MTAILLSTALVSTIGDSEEAQKRINQYVKGIEAIIDRYKSLPEAEIYLSDNTLDKYESLDPRLLMVLSRIKKNNVFIFYENDNGRVNKGCGLVAQWSRVLPIILKKHKYFIHFEPRQKIISFDFIDKCLLSKDNTFREDVINTKKFKIFPTKCYQFQTGLFGAETQIIADFSINVNIETMIKSNLSIEDLIRRFFIEKSIKYRKLSNLGLLRYAPEGEVLI